MEQARLLTEQGRRLSILFHESTSVPVAAETQFDPAMIPRDSLSRLSRRPAATSEPIEGALSVARTASVRTAGREAAEFRYGTNYLDAGGQLARWPTERWLTGGADELANAIEHQALSELRLAEGTKILEKAVRHAAGSGRQIPKQIVW